MSTAGLINRYVWFVTTIYSRGPITLEEIQHRFESHFGRGEELSERQFHRYTDAVEELFDIEIKYSRSQRGYVIADREGIYNMGMRKWLIQTFSVNNILHENQDLKNRILLENVPSGQQHLTTIVDAMREGVALSMTYHSFHREEPSTFEVEPYCIKLFEQRWYMLGMSDKLTSMPSTASKRWSRPSANSSCPRSSMQQNSLRTTMVLSSAMMIMMFAQWRCRLMPSRVITSVPCHCTTRKSRWNATMNIRFLSTASARHLIFDKRFCLWAER